MAGINPTIVSLVYAKVSRTLQVIIDAAKSIEVGFRII